MANDSGRLIEQVIQINTNLLQLRERLRLLDASLSSLGFSMKRPKTLTDSEIAQLPNTEPNSDICSICREEMTAASVILDCRHCFHRTCLGNWAKRSAVCPICRKAIETGTNSASLDTD